MSAKYKKGPLPVAEVLDAGVRIAAALETAHRSGLLHRDIKPSNILITSLGTPVLADFGVATALAPQDDGDELVAMSVPWSSPEVLEQRITGSVPSEVWSLGAALYTMLAGRSPFESPDREKNRRDVLTARIVKAKYTAIGRPDVPARIDDILARSMSKDPAARQESMYALAEELRWAQYEAGLPPTTLEVAAPEWAAAAAPVDFASSAPRGPVISTVDKNSRRAARAAQAYTARRAEDDGVLPTRAAAPWRAALIGGLVGAGVLAVIGVVILFALGVL